MKNFVYLFAIIISLSIPANVSAAWHADLLPDYTEEVEQWWHNHPFNPESPNYNMNIPHPAASVTLNSGQSIQAQIDAATSDGVTIYLNPGNYSNFSVIAKDNIHVIAISGATVNVTSEKYFAACTEALDYHNFNACVYNRNLSCIDCFRDPIKNIYIKGITFDGGGTQRDSHFMKVVRGVVFDGCTWQNYSYVGAHHPGMINGHQKLENVWFLNCHFVGTQYNGSYLDGLHAGGFVNCVFESGCHHGILMLTNDDFSEDFNENGHWDANEKRNAQYNVIVGNVFDGVPNDCIDINQGGNILIKDNVQNGTSKRFIYSTDRCSQRWHDLFYEGLYNRILDNTVNNCETFYEVNSREFNCPEYSSCDNYGKLGRYQVRGNDVTCTTFMYEHGNTIYDPRFVENNRINGFGTVVTDFVNSAPTVSITSHTDGQDVPAATQVTVVASASDADGSVDNVTFRIDDIIIGVDETAPYEMVWTHGSVTLGIHKVSVEVMDDHGKKGYEEISLDVVDTANTSIQTISDLPLNITSPIGNTVSKNFTLDLDGANAANLFIKAFDIDDDTEAKMYINGIERPLPCYVIAPDGPHTDSMEVPVGWLNDGQNTVVFEFAAAPGGTTRYEIQDFVIAVSYSGNRVATPVLTPATGSFECSVDVEMQTSTDGAEIWYTTDMTEPEQGGTSSTMYTAEVQLTTDTEIKAKAFKDGMDPSFVRTEIYTIAQSRTADIDGNGFVDIEDLKAFGQLWLQALTNIQADFNCDDDVDYLDFSKVALAWQPPVSGTYQQDSGAEGLLSMEAENNNLSMTGTQGHYWQFITTPADFSGNGAVEALPNSGTNNDSGYIVDSARMDFEINFVKNGTHYVWIRGGGDSGSDDSCHFGIDGVDISSGYKFDINEETGDWGWSSMAAAGRAVFDIDTAGVYTFNLWMREDGARIDKIVITTDSEYEPTGTGPVESPRN